MIGDCKMREKIVVTVILFIGAIALFFAYRRMISPKIYGWGKTTWWRIGDTPAAEKRMTVPRWIGKLFSINHKSVPKIVVLRIAFSFYILLNGPILSFFWLFYRNLFPLVFLIATTTICLEYILHIIIYYRLKKKRF